MRRNWLGGFLVAISCVAQAQTNWHCLLHVNHTYPAYWTQPPDPDSICDGYGATKEEALAQAKSDFRSKYGKNDGVVTHLVKSEKTEYLPVQGTLDKSGQLHPPQLNFNEYLCNAFGYVKNAQFRSLQKGTESMDGHKNWARHTPVAVVKGEVARLLAVVEERYTSGKCGPDEPWVWGELKNARLALATLPQASLAGHAQWYERASPEQRKAAMWEEINLIKRLLPTS